MANSAVRGQSELMLLRRALARATFVACAFTACADNTTAPASLPESPAFFLAEDAEATAVSAQLAALNARLTAAGARVIAARADLLLASTAAVKTPRIVFANDRTKHAPSRWVRGDLRRLATDASLSYSVFAPLALATVGGPAEGAIDASFATWNAVGCAGFGLHKKVLGPGQFPSFFFTGLFPSADINVIGFLPGAIFDQLLGPAAGAATIGLTVTYVFFQVDQNGQPILDGTGAVIPTDVDGDGRFDTAFKEIWFNDAHQYATNGAPTGIDIESVALHEAGHALELGHFGRIIGDPKTGKIHASPHAVMNAVYLGTQRNLLGLDKSALCADYRGWR
jgi:hypothetical protein